MFFKSLSFFLLNAIYGLEDLRDGHCRMFCTLISKVISGLCVSFIRTLVVSVKRLPFLCTLWHLVQVWYGPFQCIR